MSDQELNRQKRAVAGIFSLIFAAAAAVCTSAAILWVHGFFGATLTGFAAGGGLLSLAWANTWVRLRA